MEIGGRRLVLRLSLRALAELESVFEVEGIEALGTCLAKGGLRSEHVIRIVGALARGSGDGITDGEIAVLIHAADLPYVMDAVVSVFMAGFGGEAEPANPR